MNRKHLGVAVAIAAIFSVPAFAQGASGASSAGSTAGTPAPASTSANVNTNTGSQAPSGTMGGVSSGTGLPVTSGTGLAVAPSAALVAPAPAPRLLYGGAVVPYATTTEMGGPAPGITSTTTVVTRSWVNVPEDVAARNDFHRWQSLR
jgi:hypothetical protein